MGLTVDRYLAMRFHLVRSNCWRPVREGWLELTGFDLGDRTPESLSAAALIGRFDSDVPQFRRLDQPVDPSIVLMRAPSAVPHVGLFHRGRVLQLDARGASFLPLESATAGWPSVEFYAP
jgi:hypothetical protein